MMLTAISIRPRQTSAAKERARREAKISAGRNDSAMSIRLLQVDQYGIGGQERDDDRQEIDEVAQIDDAAGDRAEMAEQAGAGDGADQALGSPILQQPQYRRGAGDAQHEDQGRGDDKGD